LGVASCFMISAKVCRWLAVRRRTYRTIITPEVSVAAAQKFHTMHLVWEAISYQKNFASALNAINGEQLLVSWRVVQTLMDSLFQRFDLVPQTVQNREATGDCQHLGLFGQQALQCLLRQLLKPFDAEACPGIPHQDVLHTEDIGGVLPDQMC